MNELLRLELLADRERMDFEGREVPSMFVKGSGMNGKCIAGGRILVPGFSVADIGAWSRCKSHGVRFVLVS